MRYWDGKWKTCNHKLSAACCMPEMPKFGKKPKAKVCIQKMLYCVVACARCNEATPRKMCCGECMDKCWKAMKLCCPADTYSGAWCHIYVNKLRQTGRTYCTNGLTQDVKKDIEDAIDEYRLDDPGQRTPDVEGT